MLCALLGAGSGLLEVWEALDQAGYISRILPEWDSVRFRPPQSAVHRFTVDRHLLETCVEASSMVRDVRRPDLLLVAALLHDLGKALTPAEQLPRHHLHEHTGLKPLAAACERLKVPSEHRALAEIACREHLNVHRLDELRAATVHDLIARCDGFRKPARIAQLGLVCEADKRGRLGLNESDYPQRARLDALHRAACAISARNLDLTGLDGAAIADAVRKARVAAIATIHSKD